MWVQSLGQGDPLEEEMAAHSNILAWRIPRTEEPGGLQSMGLQSQKRLKQLGMHAHTGVQEQNESKMKIRLELL